MSSTSQVASGVREEIKRANQNLEKNFAKGDAKGMASLYTNEGMLFPSGTSVQKGTDAIRNFWQMVMDMGVKNARLETQEVEQLDDTAIEVGQYELSGADGKRIDQGKYVVIWKKENGNWKLHKDIWNTSISNN